MTTEIILRNKILAVHNDKKKKKIHEWLTKMTEPLIDYPHSKITCYVSSDLISDIENIQVIARQEGIKFVSEEQHSSKCLYKTLCSLLMSVLLIDT